MFLLVVVTVQFVSGANVTEGSNFTICLEKSVTTAVELQVLISSRDATAQNGRGEYESLSPKHHFKFWLCPLQLKNIAEYH